MTGVTNDQPAPATGLARTLLLSALLHRTAVDGAGHGLGRLSDIIVRLREDDYPLVTGLVADVGGRELFVPATEILAWDDQHLELTSARLDLRPFERRVGEVLLRGDVLGHRLVDVEQPGLVTAYDVLLTHAGESWVATAVDIHARGLLRRRAGHTWRDWAVGKPIVEGTLANAVAVMSELRAHRPDDASRQLADELQQWAARQGIRTSLQRPQQQRSAGMEMGL